MPKTTVQKIIFGLLMSYFMAIGMEIYNTAINRRADSAPSLMTSSMMP